MKITQMKINKTPEGGRMKAVISVTFDDQIVVHDIKVIDGPERYFLAMPSRKMPDGSFRDIVHPINSEARALLENGILEEYRKTEQEDAIAEAPAAEEAAQET